VHCPLVILRRPCRCRWVKEYYLDEGGYLGFMGWAIETLTGSLAYDAVAWATSAPAADAPATGAAVAPSEASPLLLGGSGVEDDGRVSGSVNRGAANVGPGGHMGWMRWALCGACCPLRLRPDATLRRRHVVAVGLLTAGAAMCLAGYLLSCLSSVIPGQVRCCAAGSGRKRTCALRPCPPRRCATMCPTGRWTFSAAWVTQWTVPGAPAHHSSSLRPFGCRTSTRGW
jgi:hypothetical protein